MAYDDQIPIGSESDRERGNAPNGVVGLRNFDEGIVLTLGAELEETETGKGHTNNYFIGTNVLPVEPAPGASGIPVVFSHPEDVYMRYRQPLVYIRRDDFSPAMNRWHPKMTEWRVPSQGANPVSITFDEGTNGEVTVSGYDSYQRKEMAVPFDITYTINILARHRGKGTLPPKGEPVGFTGATGSPRNQVNRVLQYVLERFPPYGQVYVRDSLDDGRLYSSFMESLSSLDEVPEITERVLGFAITVRVEGELDIGVPCEETVVTASPVVGLETKE
jgi:hypothetical protein